MSRSILITPLQSSGFSQRSQQSTRGTLRISETFVSRQGEGSLTGTESFFIRTSGCNLRCWFCDTPYASWRPEGNVQSIETLLEQYRQAGPRHVVLTGGEPLLSPVVTQLGHRLRAAGAHVTIETAGTLDRTVAWDLLSLSPKLSTSAPDPVAHPRWHHRHQQRRLPLATMRRLIEDSPAVQVKFVVGHREELAEIQTLVRQLPVAVEQVWLMPQGCSVPEIDQVAQWLRPVCEGTGYRFCDRKHLRWYGNRRGT